MLRHHHGGLAELLAGDHGRLRMGVDKQQKPPAAQHKLVDGVKRRIAEDLGVDNHQGFDVGRNFLNVEAQVVDLKEIADLLYDDPGFGVAAHAVHRKHAHEADGFAFRVGQGMDHLGHVVFDECFPFDIEKRENFLVTGLVLGEQAEVPVVTGL